MSGAPAKDARANVGTVASAAPAKSDESSSKASTASASSAAHDVVFLGPPTADGAGVHVLRARDERVEAGELRTLQEGRPIAGEVLTLAPRKDNPHVLDVKDSYRPPAARHASKGPAKVATDAYRDGWDEVFGKRPAQPRGSDVN